MANRDIINDVNNNDIFLGDYTTTPNTEYWGYAAPGTATSEDRWKLYVIDKDSNMGIPIGKRYAQGSPAYRFVWDLRDQYVYS